MAAQTTTKAKDTEAGDVGKAESEAKQKQLDVKPGETTPDDLVVAQPGVTTLDADVGHPGVVEPGDTPHDTVLATEHASSVTPNKAVAGGEGFGVVNAVVPIPDPSGATQARARAAQDQADTEHRMEKYTVTLPNGKQGEVEHNLDTGETKLL